MRNRAYLLLVSALFATATTAYAEGSTAARQVKAIHFSYLSHMDIKRCDRNIVKAMLKRNIPLVPSSEPADSVYKVKLDVDDSGLRVRVHWMVALENTNGELLFSDGGIESGVSAANACADLAPDLAEDLEDALNSGTLAVW